MSRMEYSQELADAICDRLAAEPLTVILSDDGMPGYSTVMRWLREQTVFRENYAHAREDQGDHDADQVAALRDRMLTGGISPEQCRVAIDSLKWSAGKRKPKVYGDKLEHTGAGGGPVQFQVVTGVPTPE